MKRLTLMDVVLAPGSDSASREDPLEPLIKSNRRLKVLRKGYSRRKRQLLSLKKSLVAERHKLHQLIASRQVIVIKKRAGDSQTLAMLIRKLERETEKLVTLQAELIPQLKRDVTMEASRDRILDLQIEAESERELATVGQVNERLSRIHTQIAIERRKLRQYQIDRLMDFDRYRLADEKLTELRKAVIRIERRQQEAHTYPAERIVTEDPGACCIAGQKEKISRLQAEYEEVSASFHAIRMRMIRASVRYPLVIE